ncbi:class I SAM-dependent methyltransferase [Streptomyces vastus]|uniref:Class I SAM-dependent methyltransferase n=1 Tax=Streptomyces vastus TaxID=285451 RepID=A0ABN3QC68_9ACTN
MSLEQVAATIAAHPWVSEVRPNADGGLCIWPDPSLLAVEPEPGALLREYLENWGELYDLVYERGDGHHAENLDLSGWRASDSGQPFATSHMTEWIDRTVELILRGRPRHVLELGCGTGLLFHRLRGQVASYVGTDVSSFAVDRLRRAVKPNEALVRAAAHEAHTKVVQDALDSVAGPDGRPDCVVLNSLTQHFPHAAYFRKVLADAIDLVQPGGRVFVGDIRHAGLLDHYCRWLELSAEPGLEGDELDQRVRQRTDREEELLADPRLIADIAARAARPVRMSVHAKTLQADTELSRYRYDVVLHVDPSDPGPPVTALAWQDLPAHDPLAALPVNAREPLRVHGIPNRLLIPEAPGALTAVELRRAVSDADSSVHIDLHSPDQLVLAIPSPAGEFIPTESSTPISALAHEPMARYVNQRIREVVRGHLRRTVPEQARVNLTVATDAL